MWTIFLLLVVLTLILSTPYLFASLFALVFGLLMWAIIGQFAGQLVRGRGYGFAGNIVLGLVGGYVGTWLFIMLGLHRILVVPLLGHFVAGVVGAMAVLALIRILVNRSPG